MDNEPKKHGSTIVPLSAKNRRAADPALTRPTHVRVRAVKEDYRRALKHGVTRQGFLPDIKQSVEWPNDVFTHRRLKEGSIVLDEESTRAVERVEGARERQTKRQAEAPKQS